MVAVASHNNPDGDAVGSVIATAEILSDAGKEPVIIPQKDVPAKYGFLSRWGSFVEGWAPSGRPDVLVCLDAGAADRLPELAAELIAAGTPVVNIDHHISNENFGTVNWVEPAAASTSLMVYRLFAEGGYEINRNAAEALYVGLVTDTGGFTYANTDAQAFLTAARLLELGASPAEVERNLYGNFEISSFHVFARVLTTMAKTGRGDIVYLYASKDMVKWVGDEESYAEGIVDCTRRVAGAKLGLFFREMSNGCVQVSFRSCDGLNVRVLAESFGGGGHNEAAGCIIKKPLTEAIETVLSRCEKWLEERD